ncbi:hypothetical protein ALC62_01280, partial [Cyphomyrmex costatus]
QICPPLQQISAERLFPSGWDIVSIEDESSPGTGFSIVAGHLEFFTQPSNDRISVSGSLLYTFLYCGDSCSRFSQIYTSASNKETPGHKSVLCAKSADRMRFRDEETRVGKSGLDGQRGKMFQITDTASRSKSSLRVQRTLSRPSLYLFLNELFYLRQREAN